MAEAADQIARPKLARLEHLNLLEWQRPDSRARERARSNSRLRVGIRIWGQCFAKFAGPGYMGAVQTETEIALGRSIG